MQYPQQNTTTVGIICMIPPATILQSEPSRSVDLATGGITSGTIPDSLGFAILAEIRDQHPDTIARGVPSLINYIDRELTLEHIKRVRRSFCLRPGDVHRLSRHNYHHCLQRLIRIQSTKLVSLDCSLPSPCMTPPRLHSGFHTCCRQSMLSPKSTMHVGGRLHGRQQLMTGHPGCTPRLSARRLQTALLHRQRQGRCRTPPTSASL